MLHNSIDFIEDLKKKIQALENEKKELNTSLVNIRIEYERKFSDVKKDQ